MSECTICQGITQSSGSNIYEDDHWILRHASETDIYGYVILEPRRHILDLASANEAEINSYGPLLSRAMKAVKKVANPVRIYTFTLGESMPHYHIHLIPRGEVFPKEYIARGIMSYPLTPVLAADLKAKATAELKQAFAC